MPDPKREFSAQQLRVIRFGGVLIFIGSFIFVFLFTGNDRFLRRCVANGNSVKYCNDIYEDRKLAFKEKELEKKRKKKELDLAEKKRKELELAEKKRKELKNSVTKTEYYGNGTYTGEYLNGKKHGQGTIVWSSGGSFVGQWRNNEKYGKGTFIYANGRTETQYW